MTLRLAPDDAGLARAAALLAEGRTVAFPTETVYGLGADARSDAAVAGIFAAKDRPRFNPLIVHLPDAEAVGTLCELPPGAERLARFWPGALTLVLPLREGAPVSPLVTAGLPTLAVRVPDHPVARALLAAFGGPVAAPSANPSGRLSPTTADHVLAGLEGRISAVLDGGACGVGVESTIVSLAGAPALLRAGGLPAERIEEALGQPLTRPAQGETPTAPGQLASHYAPAGRVRLGIETPERGETHLGFGAIRGDLSLSESGDLTEAAARLFAALHEIDRSGAERIAVAPIPDHGLGAAINDRLRRAAAPRG
ncbi:L-threonylcarbamoyladenylate synthase [Histidinibacterium aquaticum]|uniref:Threonylcarbamoyl-AMP synthase n=1 Tax=Histidinibacterium aquaticum TaxID=2613962 RepID=A0A5J5GT49_9RHOB|nr:L-threonylcarbamoyladenylate synthase [Histidinibacterium aquaticum]KAA9010562.1 threonylcarbamoyl-AMP synthase [Histidinibacterium aquaticum]